MALTYKLAVYAQDTATKLGTLEAVDPASAVGIPIPAFKMVPGRPPTGNVVGEAILDSSTNLSYVWDGLVWQSIVPPSIVAYDTDTDVLNDITAAAGVYAFSKASGNLWVRFDSGGGTLVWRPISCRVYPTQVGLLADGTAADGTMALAVDTNSIFFHVQGTWLPGSWVQDTAANILAKTSIKGQLGFSTDTNKLFFADGYGGWNQLPWREYTTEVILLADTPPNGTMAVALDTGHIAYRVNNAWKIINATVPATTPIGTIEQSILTAAQFETALSAPEKGKWALCDGRDITGSDLAAATGNNKLPDMRGAFLRMAGTNAGNAAWVGGTLGGYQEDTTARPDTAFTTNNTGNHKHRHGKKEFGPQDELWAYGYDHNKLGTGWVSNNEAGHNQYLGFTETTGQHSHSINGGGDTETRPKNFSVNYFIKINGSIIIPGSPGPSGQPGAPDTTPQADFMNYLGIIPPAQPVWDAYIYDAGGRTPVKGDVFMTVGAGTPDATWTGLSETPAGSLIVFDGTDWKVLTTPPPPPDNTVKNQWGAFKNANAMTFDDPPLPKIFLEKKIGTVLHLKTTVPDLAAGIAGNQPIPLEWDNDAGMAGGMNNVNDGDTIEVEGEAIGSGMNGKLLKKFVGTTNGLEVMGSIFGGVVMSPHDVNRNVRMIGAVPEGIQFPAAKPNSFYVDTSDPQNGVLKFMDENGVSRTVSLT